MTTRLKRASAAGAVAAVLLVAGASPAAASDFEEYLEAAAAAEYTGRRIIITIWDGESQAGIFQVTHVSNMTVIGSAEDGSLVGPGKVSAGSETAVLVPEWSIYTANERYSAMDPRRTVRLGRVAEMIEVIEDGLVRARFTFDALTKVPLATEIFDGDGSLFRYSAMLEFDPNPGLSYAALEAMDDVYDVMIPTETSALPQAAAGYIRADTYSGPDGTLQSFFTDGLFSFSLFEVDSDTRLDRFDDASTVEMNGSSYRRLITPTDVWITWTAGDVTYVLVGDLPPDHLAEVLGQLPEPREPNLLTRLWRGIFG